MIQLLFPIRYRPISLLPILSKVVEKVICIKFNDFLIANKLLLDDKINMVFVRVILQNSIVMFSLIRPTDAHESRPVIIMFT